MLFRSALLVVDLPPEEGSVLRAALQARGLSLVPLMSPTSDGERVRLALEQASGFIYYVSVTGVTGSADAPLEAASRAAAELRCRAGLPVVVGFGVDSPEKARAAAGPPDGGADGVVVGTAIVRLVEAAATRELAVDGVYAFVRSLRVALDAESVDR